MSGFIGITNSSRMSWNYLIMMNYGKTKDSQMKFDALIDKIEWLVSIA